MIDRVNSASDKKKRKDDRANENKIENRDIETFKYYAKSYLEWRSESWSCRCPRCWHDSARCICEHLPEVLFSNNVNFLVYMDYKEVYNAGDDAKLLTCVCPLKTKRIVYPLEDDDLIKYINDIGTENVIVLFPGDSALSMEEFMYQRNQEISNLPEKSDRKEGGVATLTVIIVDAVWRHARRMAVHLQDIFPAIKHVQLSPETISIYARTQSQADRICSVEATALFLKQFGESAEMCDRLVECVRLNNLGLTGELNRNPRHAALYPKSGRHPAWYFGDRFFGPA